MKLLDKIENKVERDLTLRTLEKIALIFVIVWLFIQTSSFWMGIISTIWNACQPFVYAFVIAYLLREPIQFGESHRINRKVTIAIIYIAVFLILVWLLYSLVPMFISRSGNLISSLISGINWLKDTISSMSKTGAPAWLTEIVNEMTSSLSDVKSLLPSLNTSVSGLVSSVTSTVVVIIFSVVISVFMSGKWENIRTVIYDGASNISPLALKDVQSVNHEVRTYLHSLFILMIIHFFEYMLVYLLVGHSSWLILAVATALSLLIPYLGPTIVNVIGIVTALTLSPVRVVILIILIGVLSMTDEYVLAPVVHSKNTAVTPLSALFSVFAGGALFGTVGVVVAIPTFLSIRIIYKNHKEESKKKKDNQSEEELKGESA